MVCQILAGDERSHRVAAQMRHSCAVDGCAIVQPHKTISRCECVGNGREPCCGDEKDHQRAIACRRSAHHSVLSNCLFGARSSRGGGDGEAARQEGASAPGDSLYADKKCMENVGRAVLHACLF